MYLRGFDYKYLETSDREIWMGQDNSAFVKFYSSDEYVFYTYKHKYDAGTFQMDVDLSEIGCQNIAGLYLA